MNHADVRAGLAAALRTIEEVRVADTVPSQINGLTAVIAIADGATDTDFSDGFTVNWVVLLLLPRVDDSRAQATLDEFLSTDTSVSVFTAVRNDPTLGGAVDSARITGWEPPATFEFAGTTYIGVEVGVEVIGD